MTGQMVGYVDFQELAKDLTAIQGGSVAINTKVMVASALSQIELLAEAYAPRRTGKLAGTIHTELFNNGMSGKVSVTASYAAYLEFGTGTRGEFPGSTIIIRPKNGKYLKFQGKGGQTIYAKEIRSPGMAPRPFLRPAFERVITPMVSGIADMAQMSILKGPNAPETLRNAPATGWR
jgi:HK97 gp10 family phage protein